MNEKPKLDDAIKNLVAYYLGHQALVRTIAELCINICIYACMYVCMYVCISLSLSVCDRGRGREREKERRKYVFLYASLFARELETNVCPFIAITKYFIALISQVGDGKASMSSVLKVVQTLSRAIQSTDLVSPTEWQEILPQVSIFCTM